jgi:hypothetical protein
MIYGKAFIIGKLFGLLYSMRKRSSKQQQCLEWCRLLKQPRKIKAPDDCCAELTHFLLFRRTFA